MIPWCRAVRHDTLVCRAVRHDTLVCREVRHDTLVCRAVRHDTLVCRAVRHVSLMLFVFINVYLCQTQFLYHMMFVSFNYNTTDFTGRAGNVNPFQSVRVHPSPRFIDIFKLFSQ